MFSKSCREQADEFFKAAAGTWSQKLVGAKPQLSVVLKLNGTHGAASSIAAGVSSAFVDLDLTAGPREAGPAGTGVAALASVATSGSIHAGLVVGAVVEICEDTGGTCGLDRVRHMAQQQQPQNVSLSCTHSFFFFRGFPSLSFHPFHLLITAVVLRSHKSPPPGFHLVTKDIFDLSHTWRGVSHPTIKISPLSFLTLVAEEPPPALLTVALPGLLAGPMEAARVTDALVTVAAFESHSAPVDQSQEEYRSVRSQIRCPPPSNYDLLALSGFLTEAVLLITPGQADRCRGQENTTF